MDRPPTCWMAYHSDLSDCAVFVDEIDALRYAVQNTMSVVEVPYGTSVHDAIFPPRRPETGPDQGTG